MAADYAFRVRSLHSALTSACSRLARSWLPTGIATLAPHKFGNLMMMMMTGSPDGKCHQEMLPQCDIQECKEVTGFLGGCVTVASLSPTGSSAI
jgi:hypothetical protein